MTRDIRFRIIALQVVMIVVFGFGAGLAYYAGNFTHDQVTSQLAAQQISFPADAKSGLPDTLTQYAGQQVLNGEQAHAYATNFIGLHLAATGQGHPYSYWSTQARIEKDPAKKAALTATVDTIFRGTTLQSMLNQAWAFGIVGDIATYAAYGLAFVTLIVLGALVYELFFASKPVDEPARKNAFVPTAS